MDIAHLTQKSMKKNIKDMVIFMDLLTKKQSKHSKSIDLKLVNYYKKKKLTKEKKNGIKDPNKREVALQTRISKNINHQIC